jgi:3,4-dihydroxy 2-butanone 4-phosphate synthase/GTP cyclohydrolase II
MSLNTIEEIIVDIRAGKMVILMDDEDRENEGDIVVAAEKVTPEIVNFMATEARGLICLTLTGERCDFLNLPAMVAGNGAKFSTPFTVSIEAAEGVTTGISAQDRATTIQVAVNPNSKNTDIVQPGHIFPLRARTGGVLSRAGHTEAGCDIARLAGLAPASAIVEIMNEDGTMARRPELEVFAQKHSIKIGTIADLIHYRIANDTTVKKIEEKCVMTDYGEFTLHVYTDSIHNDTHLALTLGEVGSSEPCLVRVQSSDIIRDVLTIKDSSSGSWPTHKALEKISQEGRGVLLLLAAGLSEDIDVKVDAIFGKKTQISSPNVDGSGAFVTIGTGSQIIRDLGVKHMKLLSSPVKYSGISGFDLEVSEYIAYPEK